MPTLCTLCAAHWRVNRAVILSCIFAAESPVKRRHFGGTKLGTGGLARAYGGAARQCLQVAPQHTVSPTVVVQLEARLCPHLVLD